MIADFGAKLVRYVASKKKRSIGSSTGAARYTRSLDMPFQPVIFADGQYAIFEDMYGHEGKYPNRGPTFAPWILMRERRNDIFYETKGVFVEEGQRWHDVRSKVQQDFMRPKSAYFYIDEIQNVSCDFIEYIKAKRSSQDKSLHHCYPDFLKYSFESISVIALETRLGCLKPTLDPEIDKLFTSVNALLESLIPMLQKPLWKYLPSPRWDRQFRESEDNFGILVDFCQKQIANAQQKIELDQDKDHRDEMSILAKMMQRNGPDSSYPMVMALDMMFAGIDTTGLTLAYLMYHLAAHPDQQAKAQWAK